MCFRKEQTVLCDVKGACRELGSACWGRSVVTATVTFARAVDWGGTRCKGPDGFLCATLCLAGASKGKLSWAAVR